MMRKRNDCLHQISWPARVLSRRSFNFDKKLNAALRHSSKRLDIEHQCLQIRTHYIYLIKLQSKLTL